MSNNKQSSIEWLTQRVLHLDWQFLTQEKKRNICKQAKAMHRKEVVDFVEDWYHNGLLSLEVLVSTSVENHYNKTFKQ